MPHNLRFLNFLYLLYLFILYFAIATHIRIYLWRCIALAPINNSTGWERKKRGNIKEKWIPNDRMRVYAHEMFYVLILNQANVRVCLFVCCLLTTNSQFLIYIHPSHVCMYFMHIFKLYRFPDVVLFTVIRLYFLMRTQDPICIAYYFYIYYPFRYIIFVLCVLMLLFF